MNAQIPKDSFELMRQLRIYEKVDNTNLQMQQKQNRTKKQELVREAIEKRFMESEDYTFSEEGLRRTRAYEDRIKMENEDILSLRIETKLREAKKDEFRRKIRIEAEIRRQKEIEEREVRKHLAEERRKVVVERIRKKQEEEERKLKEAELEKNRIVEEKERLKREAEERVRLNRSRMLHEDDLSKLYEQDYKDEIERKLWLQKQSESINAWEILQKQKDLEEQQEQALRMQELELKKLKLIEMRKLQENKSKSVDAIALAREEAEKLNRQMRIQNKAKFVSKKMKTEKMSNEVETRDKQTTANSTTPLQETTQSRTPPITGENNDTSSASTGNTTTNIPVAVSAPVEGIHPAPPVPQPGPPPPTVEILPPAFLQQINASSSETELRALQKSLMEEKRLLRLGNYHVRPEGNETVPETNTTNTTMNTDHQTVINQKIKTIHLQEDAIEKRINTILNREGNKGCVGVTGGANTDGSTVASEYDKSNNSTVTTISSINNRQGEIARPLNNSNNKNTNTIKSVPQTSPEVPKAPTTTSSSSSHQVQSNADDQLFKKAEQLLHEAQEISKGSVAEQVGTSRRLGLLEMEIQNIINKLINTVDPIGYTAKLKDAQRKLKIQKESLTIASVAPSTINATGAVFSDSIPNKSLVGAAAVSQPPAVEALVKTSTMLPNSAQSSSGELPRPSSSGSIDLKHRIAAPPATLPAVARVTPLSTTAPPVNPHSPPLPSSLPVVNQNDLLKGSKNNVETAAVVAAVAERECVSRRSSEVLAPVTPTRPSHSTTPTSETTNSTAAAITTTPATNGHARNQLDESEVIAVPKSIIYPNAPPTSAPPRDDCRTNGYRNSDTSPSAFATATAAASQSPRGSRGISGTAAAFAAASANGSSRPSTPVKLVQALKQASVNKVNNSDHDHDHVAPLPSSSATSDSVAGRRISVGVTLPPLPSASAPPSIPQSNSRRVSRDISDTLAPPITSIENNIIHISVNANPSNSSNRANIHTHNTDANSLLSTHIQNIQHAPRPLIRPPSVQDLQTHTAIKSLSAASSGLNVGGGDSSELSKSKSALNIKLRQSLTNFETLIETELLLDGIDDIKTVQEEDNEDTALDGILGDEEDAQAQEDSNGTNNGDGEAKVVDFEQLPGWTECMHTSMASAAHHAAFYGYDLVLETLGRCFDVFVLDDKGRTPLFYAALRNHLNCVTALASIDAQWIDVGDINGDTPLHAAAISNGVDVLEFLLSCECNPDIANYEGYTPSHLAKTDSALAALHRAGAILYCMDSRSRLPLWLACKEGRAECVHFLCSVTPAHFLMWGDDEGDSCIHVAATEGFHKVVEVICQWISSVEDLYVVNNKKYTAAHMAATSAVLQKLYENGAELWIRDPKGRYPLFFASFFGRVDCVAFLLEIANMKSGDVISAPDNVGDTALHAACLRGHLQCALLLLYFIRDVPNAGGLLASQLANRAGHRHLAKVVAHIEGKKVNGMTAEEIFGCSFEHMSAVIYYYGSRWIKLYDNSSGLLYYYDRATSISQWERPEQYDENPIDESNSDKARFILIRFYTQYNPEKLSSIDEIMMAYKGNFIQLFLQLAERYNVQDLSIFAGVLDDTKISR